MASKVDSEKLLSEKQMIEQIRDDNPVLWNEISEYMALLEEWGISSYKLTGSLEEPIVTGYTFDIG